MLGLPRIPTYTISGGSNQCLCPRAPEGPSYTGAGLDDTMLQRVMAAVLERFGTDSNTCLLRTLNFLQLFFCLSYFPISLLLKEIQKFFVD